MITKVDNSGLTSAIRELAKIAKVSLPKATLAEGGKVLGLCVKYTGSAKASAYPRKGSNAKQGSGFAKSGDAELWVNTTGKGGSPIGQTWLIQPNGQLTKNGQPAKGKYLITGPGGGPPIGKMGRPYRWSNERWALAQSLLAQADPGQQLTKKAAKDLKKLTGRGLAKAAWVQIGRALGIPVDPAPPGYVLKAIPQDGRARIAGTGRRVQTPEKFLLQLEMRYPLLIGGAKKPSANLDAAAIIGRAAKARASAFLFALKNGVFSDAKARCARYGALFK